MIRDGENGLLANFFDADEIAAKALDVLRDPAAFRPLGRAAEEVITRDYSLEAVLPRMLKLYQDAVDRRAASPAPKRKAPRPSAQPPQPRPPEKSAKTPFLG
jgi:hypothetical protein